VKALSFSEADDMPDLWMFFVEPVLTYGFMRDGLMAAAMVGTTSAILSCLLVVRGQALLGDAISHSVLLGVVVGYLVGGELGIVIGALAIAMLTGAGITYITRNAPFRAETSMGILFTVMFALGLAILSAARPRGIDLQHVLFGNVLGVSRTDLLVTSINGAIVVTIVLVGFRAFHLWSFDPDLAFSMGVRTRRMDYLFNALLSAAIVAALQTVGIILVIAMLVIPGAAAAMVTSRLRTMMVVAASLGLFSAVSGLYGSYYLDVASGPAIVLVAGACFTALFVFAPRGVLGTHLTSRRRMQSSAASRVRTRGRTQRAAQ